MGNVHSIRSVGTTESSDEVNLEIDDTQSVLPLTTPEPGACAILVLSRHKELTDTIRRSNPRGTAVSVAPDLDHAAETLSSLRPGVLVVDTASTNDVAGMVAQLTQHFPELVVVVAGRREDSAALMQLTAAGRIFRFLLTPLSQGQTKLTLEAAVAQHTDLVTTAERKSTDSSNEKDSKNYLKGYLALGSALVVVIGGIWFAVSSMTGEPQPVTAAVQAPVPSSLGDRPDPITAELNLAKEAFDAGRYLEPAGESALDLYRSALALDPDNPAARAGRRAVADKVLERAEAALLAEKLEEAIKNIETARDIEPAHPRLSFLDTQIARERERLKLTQAHEVSLKVRDLLSAANSRIERGALVTPAGSSARDALVEARRIDPTDPDVARAIRALSNQLAEEATQALAAGHIEKAQTLIMGARQLGSAGTALAAAERQLAEVRTSSQRSAAASAVTRGAAAQASLHDELINNIRQRISKGQLIDPKGDSAHDLLAQLRTADPSNAAMDDLAHALSTRLIDTGRQAMTAKAYERSQQLLTAAREVGARANEATLADVESQLAKSLAEHAFERNVVSAGSLKRTKVVAPDYPALALRRNLEGWVEVAFTVTESGKVDAVEVRNSSPADIFDDAATRAVRQWRFEPVVRDGKKVPQRAMVRLKFAAE